MKTVSLTEEDGFRLAVVGCGHGVLHSIYASVQLACSRQTPPWPGVDLVIVGGDCQTVRNAYDLHCVSMPAKYRAMHDFHEYYSGNRTAPYLTVFVGGNHEASNYLWELYYGGWVARRIWYMGVAGVIRVGPLRIMGMSGIWKGFDYRKTHRERLPYSFDDLKSIYHVRELDVRKLLQIRTQVDIGISHDWPRDVVWKGNWKQLFAYKKFLEDDARKGQLGSVAAEQVMEHLRPKWWFSAHLHCKYAAIVHHGDGDPDQAKRTDGPSQEVPAQEQANTEGSSGAKNVDEIELDLDDASEQPKPDGSSGAVALNADEIDLELENDNDDGTADVAPDQGLDGIKATVDISKAPTNSSAQIDESVSLGGNARAALPASFFTRDDQNPGKERPNVQFKPTSHPQAISNTTTLFLALSKCLPNQHFLQLTGVSSDAGDKPISTPVERPLQITYDKEWLAITRAFALHEPLILGNAYVSVPPPKTQEEYAALIDEQLKWIDHNLTSEDLIISENSFEVTAPTYDGGDITSPGYRPENGGLVEYTNMQTTRFCRMLKIPNEFDMDEDQRAKRMEKAKDFAMETQSVSRSADSWRGRGGSRGHGRGRGGGNRAGRGSRGRGR